jgi:hypothetical protein
MLIRWGQICDERDSTTAILAYSSRVASSTKVTSNLLPVKKDPLTKASEAGNVQFIQEPSFPDDHVLPVLFHLCHIPVRRTKPIKTHHVRQNLT